jgi:hypothetical protein
MSFMLTTQQVKDGTKTVTRRNGWAHLKPGEVFQGVEKCQGLKKGEKLVKLRLCRCVSNRREPLNAITAEDCSREGFPEMTPADFVAFYAAHNKCEPDAMVSRIEFGYLD